MSSARVPREETVGSRPAECGAHAVDVHDLSQRAGHGSEVLRHPLIDCSINVEWWSDPVELHVAARGVREPSAESAPRASRPGIFRS